MFMLATREKEFAGQPIQAELPVNSLYVLTKQFVHAAPSFPVHPALQVQLVMTVLATGEPEFAGHRVQTELNKYELTLQKAKTQGPPVGPVHPKLQVQAVMTVLATGELEFVGQLRQLDFPLNGLYVPAKQFVHAPLIPLNNPALHEQIKPALIGLVVVRILCGEKLSAIINVPSLSVKIIAFILPNKALVPTPSKKLATKP